MALLAAGGCTPNNTNVVADIYTYRKTQVFWQNYTLFGCLSHSLDNQHRVGSLEGHPDSTGEVNLEHTDISTGLSAYIHTDIQTYPDKHADIHTGISAYIHTDIPWQTHWHSHRYQCHTYIHTYRHTLTNSWYSHRYQCHTYIQTYPDKHADIHTGISVIHTYKHTLTNTLIFTQGRSQAIRWVGSLHTKKWTFLCIILVIFLYNVQHRWSSSRPFCAFYIVDLFVHSSGPFWWTFLCLHGGVLQNPENPPWLRPWDIPRQTRWHSHRYQCIHTYRHTLTSMLTFTQVSVHTYIQTYPDKHTDIHTGISTYIHTDIPWQTHCHSNYRSNKGRSGSDGSKAKMLLQLRQILWISQKCMCRIWGGGWRR